MITIHNHDVMEDLHFLVYDGLLIVPVYKELTFCPVTCNQTKLEAHYFARQRKLTLYVQHYFPSISRGWHQIFSNGRNLFTLLVIKYHRGQFVRSWEQTDKKTYLVPVLAYKRIRALREDMVHKSTNNLYPQRARRPFKNVSWQYFRIRHTVTTHRKINYTVRSKRRTS